jgi:asparagine synthase (glutamine-hydrolysing)
MSGLSGVFYWEPAPISDRDWAWLSGTDSDGFRTVLSPAARLWVAKSEDSALSARGNLCVWEGRLHNRSAIRQSAEIRESRPPGDSRLALAAYEAGGVEALASLIGDWSLTIWDERRQALFLASDYSGACPLFYYRDAHKLLWSSSLEHLRQAVDAGPLDESYASALITRGSGRQWTPYRGIRLVPCGAALMANRRRFDEFQFWKPPENALVLSGDAEYEERFRELFREAVAVRLDSRRPVCAELSGGLDSSSIVCMASRLISAGEVPAPGLITFSYLHPDSIDRPFIDVVEHACGIRGIHLDIAQCPPITAHAGGPSPLWWEPRLNEIAARMAALNSEVFLTGQLGDLTAGNWADDSEQVGDRLKAGELAGAVREALSWSRALRVPIWGILWRALRSAVRYGSDDFFLGTENSEESLTPQFRKRAACLVGAPVQRAGGPVTSPSRRKHLLAFRSMVEARVLQRPAPFQDICYSHPFLHRPLVEFMLSIPPAVVCRPNEPRRLMRRALKGIVPEAVLRRRSKGTYNGEFIRALQPLADLLLPEVERMHLVQTGFLRADSVGRRLRRLMEGLECNEPQLRRLILLEFWLRNHLQNPRPPIMASRSPLPPNWASASSECGRATIPSSLLG